MFREQAWRPSGEPPVLPPGKPKEAPKQPPTRHEQSGVRQVLIVLGLGACLWFLVLGPGISPARLSVETLAYYRMAGVGSLIVLIAALTFAALSAKKRTRD